MPDQPTGPIPQAIWRPVAGTAVLAVAVGIVVVAVG